MWRSSAALLKLLPGCRKPIEIKPGRSALGLVYWSMLAALLILFHTHYPLDSDEGVVLNGAWHLLHGKELYVDLFEFITPGSFYLVFWAWKLFGPSYAVAKALGVAAVFLGAIGIFRTSRLFVDSPAAYLPPLLFCLLSNMWAIVSHNTFNVPLLVWATYFAARGSMTRCSADIAASGLLTGIAILFLQHKGVALLLAVALFFLFQHAREKQSGWARHAALYFVFSLLPLTALLVWPLPTLYESLVHFPLFRYTRINWVPPYALMASAVTGALIFWALRKDSGKAVGLLAAVQGILLLTALQRPDPIHVSFVIFPLLLLLPMVFERLQQPGSTLAAVGAFFTAFAVTLFLVATIFLGTLAFRINFGDWRGMESPAIRYVRQHCNSPYLYAGPYLAGLYYQTGKLNPTPFALLLTDYNTEEQFRTARIALEKAFPDCAVLYYARVSPELGHDIDNPVDKFILTNYSYAFRDDDVLVYRKNP